MSTAPPAGPGPHSERGRPARVRLTRLIGGGALAVLLLALGLPYLYLHLVAGPAPEALALPTTATPAPAVGTVEGVWRVAAGSQAGYRVEEVLAGQQAVAVGRTSKVDGQITVSGSSVTAGSFHVDLTTVTSDSPQRDNQFRGRIMDTARYPTTTFTLTRPFDLGPLTTSAGTTTMRAAGTLALHGRTRPATADLTAVRSGGTVEVTAQIPVRFADYDIPNPSFGNVVRTGDTGTIEVLLRLVKG